MNLSICEHLEHLAHRADALPYWEKTLDVLVTQDQDLAHSAVARSSTIYLLATGRRCHVHSSSVTQDTEGGRERLSAARQAFPPTLSPVLVDNVNGNYRFLPGIDAYSSGVVAMPGHQVIHVTLRRPVPYHDGFEMIDAHLREE